MVSCAACFIGDFAMHPLVNTAVRAAHKAGDYIARNVDRVDTLKISQKAANDFVTNVDQQAEKIIIDTIRDLQPTHSFLCEESGYDGDSDFQWIIDPIDGTTNFIHGNPQFAISIALKIRDELEVGVIYDPLRQELFTAKRGEGAQLNDRRIRISQQRELPSALIGTGIPFKADAPLDDYFAMLKAVTKQQTNIRRAGSAALDLAWVAAGRLDGFWELGLQPWDIAAGILLIHEAGGRVSDMHGRDPLKTGNVVAGNPKIHNALLRTVSPYMPRATK